MKKADFAERLSEMMQETGVTHDRLSKELGFSLSTAYTWQRDKRNIRLSNFVALCFYFDCSLDFMAGRTENNSKPSKRELPKFMDSVRAIMRRKKISSYKMRKETRFSGGHFNNWENGAEPQLSTLIELANYFNCSLDELVGLEA